MYVEFSDNSMIPKVVPTVNELSDCIIVKYSTKWNFIRDSNIKQYEPLNNNIYVKLYRQTVQLKY